MMRHLCSSQAELLTRRQWLRRSSLGLATLGFGGPFVLPAHADEIPSASQPTVTKGLEWVARVQQRDGHWEGEGGQYPTALTALGGMSLLMEGSTLNSGKYATQLRRAVEWFMERSQRNGLLGQTSTPQGSYRYMYGHGFGMLFLASVYGEEEDNQRRSRLEDVLTRGVEFTAKAQTSKGGWGYLARGCNQEGDDRDEGSVTITQVQALRAARNAGIITPKSIIDKTLDYLKACTGPNGGIYYSPDHRQEKPALTAAGIACGFNAGQYESPLVKKWLSYCRTHIPVGESGGRIGHDEYLQYYYAQVMYLLGEDRYAKLFPESKEDERLTWSKYRKAMFEFLARSQNADGSWTSTFWGGRFGPIYASSMALTILQLDKAVLPIYQR